MFSCSNLKCIELVIRSSNILPANPDGVPLMKTLFINGMGTQQQVKFG